MHLAEPPACDDLQNFDVSAFNRRIDSSRHIALLMAHIPGVNYFAKDQLGRFVQADAGFVSMLGARNLDDILGRTDADFFPPEIAAGFVADDQAVMTTGEPLIQQIEPVPRPDRTFEWRTVTKVALRDADDKVIGVAGITYLNDNADNNCPPGIFSILEHIGQHYSRPLTMDDFTELSGLSPSTIERNFAQIFKTSPLRYLNAVRLRAARHLLINTEEKLSDIAVGCGFCDQSHMTALFKQKFEITPRRYRDARRRE